jgi:hypothetical protein
MCSPKISSCNGRRAQSTNTGSEDPNTDSSIKATMA